MSSNGNGNAVENEVICRVVGEEEFFLLQPLFDKIGWPLPPPDRAKIIVAEIAGDNGDKLVLGFTVVQLIVHTEPMWIAPPMRGTGVAEKLAQATRHYLEEDCKVSQWVCMAKPGSFAARIAEANGMVPQTNSMMFVKR